MQEGRGGRRVGGGGAVGLVQKEDQVSLRWGRGRDRGRVLPERSLAKTLRFPHTGPLQGPHGWTLPFQEWHPGPCVIGLEEGGAQAGPVEWPVVHVWSLLPVLPSWSICSIDGFYVWKWLSRLLGPAFPPSAGQVEAMMTRGLQEQKGRTPSAE